MRRYPRFRVDFPVEVTLFDEGAYRRHRAQCKDLSEAGIGLLIASQFELGEVASLSFTPPGTSQVWDLSAVLRHKRGYHYGFEFLSLLSEQKEILKLSLKGLDSAD